ncbi:MAG: DUF2252 domain-containing protein [Candidatus Dormiibacterota bacterium]
MSPAEPDHPSVEERVTRGREARRRLARSDHGRWAPAAARPDPVSLLQEQGETREAELVPVRHGRMLVSPFAFYRGAALIMASDLSATPHTGLDVQLCGDAHLGNFGVFASPERQLMFDINDFDETLNGPWEWDVKRLAASFEIAGRDRGFSAADRRAIVRAGVKEYQLHMGRAAEMGTLDVWYAHMENAEMLDLVKNEVRKKRLRKREAREILTSIAKARTRDSARAFSKSARDVDGDLLFVPQPPLIVPIEELLPPGRAREQHAESIRRLIRTYRRTLAHEHHPLEAFQYLHMARKVVGVGSVGTRCWIMLMVGRDTGDPLILQAKEAQQSVLERFLGTSSFANHGQRVVVGQRLMQAASDIVLGWVRVRDFDGETRDYYVRQFHDWKGSLDIDSMGVPAAILYAELCGGTLARAHARSGDRVAIAAYLGSGDAFERGIADFCVAYADQNERDHQAFADAVSSGRIEATAGV